MSIRIVTQSKPVFAGNAVKLGHGSITNHVTILMILLHQQKDVTTRRHFAGSCGLYRKGNGSFRVAAFPFLYNRIVSSGCEMEDCVERGPIDLVRQNRWRGVDARSGHTFRAARRVRSKIFHRAVYRTVVRRRG